MGTKRIGVAVSDELKLTAKSVRTIERMGLKKDISSIRSMVKEYNIETIVVGMPYNLDGKAGEMALAVKSFADRLRKSTGLNVVEWDERFSTIAVTRVLHDADMSRAKRKGVVDELSAVYILQGYLDSRNQ